MRKLVRRVLRDLLIATAGAALGSWAVGRIRDDLEVRGAMRANADYLRAVRESHERIRAVREESGERPTAQEERRAAGRRAAAVAVLAGIVVWVALSLASASAAMATTADATDTMVLATILGVPAGVAAAVVGLATHERLRG